MLLYEAPPVSIFISYRRSSSSALAMLIHAELRVEGFNPFLDIRTLVPGDEWHRVLRQRVMDASVFISVLAPDSLASENVAEEVAWALESPQTRIIPVLHAGLRVEDLRAGAFPQLADKNLILLEEDRAADIYAALEQIRMVFGLMR
ncbi:MAG: toll/interleukin-1 receptor domain-containing protein [Anaerolineae bacterium]|nr:toll/interleukin-1 receptor domain-containing protein [Anaerolineae bacterium]